MPMFPNINCVIITVKACDEDDEILNGSLAYKKQHLHAEKHASK